MHWILNADPYGRGATISKRRLGPLLLGQSQPIELRLRSVKQGSTNQRLRRPSIGHSEVSRRPNLPLVQHYRLLINHVSKPPVYPTSVNSFGNLAQWR